MLLGVGEDYEGPVATPLPQQCHTSTLLATASLIVRQVHWSENRCPS